MNFWGNLEAISGRARGFPGRDLASTAEESRGCLKGWSLAAAADMSVAGSNPANPLFPC